MGYYENSAENNITLYKLRQKHTFKFKNLCLIFVSESLTLFCGEPGIYRSGRGEVKKWITLLLLYTNFTSSFNSDKNQVIKTTLTLQDRGTTSTSVKREDNFTRQN